MAHSSTGYPSSEAACYAAVKLVGVPDLSLIVSYGFEKKLWGMNLFAKDLKFIKAGDLMMSLAGGENRAPVYFRLLRRVK
ncbi:hypothetical protein MRM75_04390 [bacterium 19CA06SA08-2]|uniref:Uncharacterized protein n=2 Tax=Bacteria TaxID=2 RepID=A0AAU6U8E5_UNCXX